MGNYKTNQTAQDYNLSSYKQDSNGDVALNTISEVIDTYLHLLPLIQASGLLSFYNYDSIELNNVSATQKDLHYFSSGALKVIMRVVFSSKVSWSISTILPEYLLQEDGDKLLLESGFELILEG